MDLLSYLLGKKAGGGGGEAVLINKSVTANGTYNASSDSADGYKKVEVAVPNSYGAGDEGKVVSNGALVAQGSDTVTANDTYDTTLISEMVVNVPTPAQLPTVAELSNDTLTSLFGAGITRARSRLFEGNTNLKTVVLPDVTTTGTYIGNASGIETMDMGVGFDTINNASFQAPNMVTLILRRSTRVAIGNNGFGGTPFKSGGTGGDIYIPKSLYDHLGDGTANDYKASTNWATYDGYGTITWKKIEGSIYETQYADGTPIT